MPITTRRVNLDTCTSLCCQVPLYGLLSLTKSVKIDRVEWTCRRPLSCRILGHVAADLGSRIRRLRRERGLTQAGLAGSRLSESYVSLIESGRRVPTGDVLEYLAEALDCTIGTLTGADEPPDAAQAELLIRRGEWETTAGHPATGRQHLVEGMSLASRLELPALVARARVGVARALEAEGRLRDAVQMWEELLKDSDDRRNSLVTTATVGLSRCCRELGDLDRAIEVGEAFWSRAEAENSDTVVLEDRVVVGATLLAAYLEIGDQDRCQALAKQLIRLAEAAETPMATGAAYWNAALAAETEGRVAEALRLAERADSYIAQTRDVRNRARLQVALGGLHLRMRPPEIAQALRLLEAAEPVLRQFGSTVDVGYCRTELARAHLQSHDYKRACCIATQAANELQAEGESPIELARTLMVLAAAKAALDEKPSAISDARRAAELLEAAGATRQAASRWTELAELLVGLGDSQAAIQSFRKATSLLGARTTAGMTSSSAEYYENAPEAEAG